MTNPAYSCRVVSIRGLLRLKIRGFRIRTNPAILPIKRSDLCEILGIQGKIEYIEIFADARRRYSLRDHNVTTIEVPSNNNLGRRFAVLFRQCLQRGILQQSALSQR